MKKRGSLRRLYKDKEGQLLSVELKDFFIGMIVLVIMFIVYFILSGKAEAILDFIKNIFRFG